MITTDPVIYEGDSYRVLSKEEAVCGIYIQVKQDGVWDVGPWDGRLIVKDLIDDVKSLKKSLEAEKTKRFL